MVKGDSVGSVATVPLFTGTETIGGQVRWQSYGVLPGPAGEIRLDWHAATVEDTSYKPSRVGKGVFRREQLLGCRGAASRPARERGRGKRSLVV
jgi:hypothetical protein